MVRNIYTDFWTDSKILDFSPEDKLFYLYLMTNPHTNIAGCYEISKAQIGFEVGYSKESINVMIDRFENQYNIIRYDTNTCEMLLLNWPKWNWNTSPKLEQAVEKVISTTKNKDFKHFLEETLRSNDRVSIGYQYPMHTIPNTSTSSLNTNTNTIFTQVSKEEECKEEEIFKDGNIPSLDEIKLFALQEGLPDLAEKFWDYYDALGWRVGGSKIVKWKSIYKNWCSKEKQFNKTGMVNHSGIDFSGVDTKVQDLKF